MDLDDNMLTTYIELLQEENDMEIRLHTIKRMDQLAKIIGPEKTRTDLLTFFRNYVTPNTDDEILLAIAEMLKNFIPLVGGPEYAKPILDILANLCCADETLVRDAAVSTIKFVTKDFSEELCETLLIPYIEELIRQEWSLTRCTVPALFVMCYSKINDEMKKNLRTLFITVIQDDSPLVRKAASGALAELINDIEHQFIINEFVPVLHNITMDPQDSVRVMAIDICISISRKLSYPEFKKYIHSTIDLLKCDQSWKTLNMLAVKILDILSIHYELEHLDYVLEIYKKLLNNNEIEVRIEATTKLYEFAKCIGEHFLTDAAVFEQYFELHILPIIHEILESDTEETKIALSNDITRFGQILRKDTFETQVFPIIINTMRNERNPQFQQNILMSLHNIPNDLNLTDFLKDLTILFRSIIETSQLHWRVRRNLLLALLYTTRFAKPEYFDEYFKIYYVSLISDKVVAVRRSAAVILPVLAQRYGIQWLSESIVPIFMRYTKSTKYLFNYIPLFCINELISPTLEKQIPEKYLKDHKILLENIETQEEAQKIVLRTFKIFNKIKTRLEDEVIQNMLSEYTPTFGKNENDLTLYLEDTLDLLQVNCEQNFFAIKDTQSCTYLEGLLILIYKKFLDVIIKLSDSRVENVRARSKYTLNNIKKFLEKLNNEFNQTSIKDAMKKVSAENVEEIEKNIEEILSSTEIEDDDFIDTDLMDDLGHAKTLRDYKQIPSRDSLNSMIGKTEFITGDNVEENNGAEEMKEIDQNNNAKHEEDAKEKNDNYETMIDYIVDNSKENNFENDLENSIAPDEIINNIAKDLEEAEIKKSVEEENLDQTVEIDSENIENTPETDRVTADIQNESSDEEKLENEISEEKEKTENDKEETIEAEKVVEESSKNETNTNEAG